MISDRQSTAGTSVSAALIIFVGLLTAPIGITGFAAIGYKAIGLLLLIMALSGIFLIATGIQMIVRANRLERDMKRLEDNNTEHPPQYHPAYQ